MSLKNDLGEILGIDQFRREMKIAYLFKKGESINSLSKKFKLSSTEVESYVRKYMGSDERFEDVEDEDEDEEEVER